MHKAISSPSYRTNRSSTTTTTNSSRNTTIARRTRLRRTETTTSKTPPTCRRMITIGKRRHWRRTAAAKIMKGGNTTTWVIAAVEVAVVGKFMFVAVDSAQSKYRHWKMLRKANKTKRIWPVGPCLSMSKMKLLVTQWMRYQCRRATSLDGATTAARMLIGVEEDTTAS